MLVIETNCSKTNKGRKIIRKEYEIIFFSRYKEGKYVHKYILYLSSE
jgi:hypothetical protein